MPVPSNPQRNIRHETNRKSPAHRIPGGIAGSGKQFDESYYNQQGTTASMTGANVLLLATVIVLVGCIRAEEAPPAPSPPQVAVVTVERGRVPVTTELPGRTSAYFVAQVRARVDGIVQKREYAGRRR